MSIYEKLFDWQKEIVQDLKDKNSYGLFLDMGLGKTPISLALAEVNECEKVLVVSLNAKALEDKDVKGSFCWWGSQSAMEWNCYCKKSIFNTDKKGKWNVNVSTSTNDLFCINYEGLYERLKSEKRGVVLNNNLMEFLNSCGEKKIALILDESHKVKNLNSIQTQAIKKIIQTLHLYNCTIKTYLLTGTPFTCGYEDLYSQLKILGYPENKTHFLDRYCIRGNIRNLPGWAQPIIGYKNEDELIDIVHQYAITIKSVEKLGDKLPAMVFSDHVLKESLDMKLFSSQKIKVKELNKILDERQIKLDRELWELDNPKDIQVPNPFYRNIDCTSEKWLANTASLAWMRARQLSIGFQGNSEEAKWFDKSRLQALKDFLENNRDNYVLFYNFTPELLEIYDICQELGYNIDVFCGEIKSLTYYEKFSKLPKNEKLTNVGNIIISNYASGSTGKNWQEYNKCILFSIPLFADYEQGLKRINRLGQESKITIYHRFYSNNYLDNSMLEALEQKKQYDSDMFLLDEKNQNI